MSKRGIFCLVAVASVLVMLFLASSTDWLITEKAVEIHQVSVLVDAEDDHGLSNFKLGLEQAAMRLNADLSFITLYDEKEPEQQGTLLLREVNSGAQGIILLAENASSMEKMLGDVPVNVPVVIYGSSVDSPRVKAVLCPSWVSIAKDLAKVIISENGTKLKVTIVTTTKNKTNVETMKNTMLLAITQAGAEVSMVQLQSLDDVKTLADGLTAQGGNIVFTPELNTLEVLAQSIGTQADKLPLYGVGWSGTIWHSVENGYIKATVVCNDYNGGYLALRELKASLDGKNDNREGSEIPYAVVNKENLYTDEIETMLFPIW
ncbi:MAG: substrate-binding domain-containing protein [Lachnospiraceae bacterium]|nr:substrate-binding domain-containing protein [Lachnospiraceae bacterium]